MEDRIELAVSLFKEGYNCSQAVVTAYADLYGFTREQALKMSASFGGGIGRMRKTCGAACGLFMLAGLETGCTDGKDREGKEANYILVQQLAEEFAKRNGSITCAELLGLEKSEVTQEVEMEAAQEILDAISNPNIEKVAVETIEKAAELTFKYSVPGDIILHMGPLME